MRVLVVDDDAATAAYLCQRLQENGYHAESSGDGRDAYEKASSTRYDFIVLDVVLPSLDGLTLCRRLRRDGQTVKILMLSQATAVDDRVAGLDAGANDYLDKPFAFRELLARLHALERAGRDDPTILRVGALELDLINHTAVRSDRPIELTEREFSLLELLMQHAGESLSRTMIVSQVWGGNFMPDSNLVDVYISRLRRKIDDPFSVPLIETVHSIGYRLIAAET